MKGAPLGIAKISKPGWPFIIPSLVLAILFFYWGIIFWGLAFTIITIFFVQFFRDPDRKSPDVPEGVLAPADGRVVEVGESYEGDFLGAPAKKVSIFMNIFNVHVNRAPLSGRVTKIARFKGRYLAADKEEASRENFRNSLLLETDAGHKAVVVQVAGLLARRIICYAREGDFLPRGQRFGLILFGSRVDLYLPLCFEPKVAVGQKARAGLTVLGVLRDETT